jgi:hypothetical protein
MDALQILVPLLRAMLGIAVGYFLKRAEYEMQRRDQLADRELNRRLAAKDKRISDAQDYLNTYLELTRTMMKVEIGLATTGDADKHQAEYDRIIEITNNLSANRMLSIFQLDDSELRPLNIELILLAQKEYANTVDLMLATKKKETIDQETALARIAEFSRRTGTIIGAMQIKLNNIAERV